uniref:SH3 domain-containing protein n=2 Tax=Clytia hemisphaerica TaxID=252671 RepID=A0A7M5URS8_9CNID
MSRPQIFPSILELKRGHDTIQGHKKKTGLLPHFTKHYGSRKMDGGGNSLKGKSNNGLQMGVPHIALFDFQPQDYRELKLTRGELVEVTSVDSGGWAKAVNKEKKFGWVPQNFISPIEPKKYQEIKMKTEAIHTLAGLDVALGADEEEECYHVPHSIPKPLHHKSDSDCSEEISQLFITIYPFEPNQIETESTSNELKLEVGDLIDVLKTNETGWWKGRCLRTEDEGWFPSSYVKPYMPEVIEEEKSIALSDTEVIRRAAESSILKTKPIDGYSSDNGEVRTKMLRENSTTSKDVEDSNNAEAAPDITAKKESVILRPKKGSPKERAVSLYIDTEMPTTKIQSPAPLTPPPRLSNHRDHGTEKAFAVPPSKPVPPPPRQKHIEKEYSHLVASGRLGSQDSLKTVSTECLASLGGRSPRKRGSDRRRNSEEISKTNIDDVVRRYQDPAKLNRIRPKSFQAPETPKSSFLSLVTKMHQQSSIKSALSLPSLVGDQMKLSPDDDRPFLDPIPRKAKSRSFVGSNATIGLFSERNCSSMKDLSQAGTIESNWLQRHHLKQSSLTDISRDSMRSASATSLSSSTNDLNVMKKPLPPEPNESEADELRSSLTSKSFQGMGLSHHGLGPNSMMSQLLRPPLISQKPVAPPRSSSKNNNAKKLIEEQRSRQGGSGLLSEHYSRAPFVYGRLRQHISFESINEESEQASTPKDETVKLPGDHDHRRSRSEPHERILQNEARSFTLSGRKLTETEISSPVSEQPESNKTLRPTSIEDSDSRIQVACDERGVRTLTYDSRVSSLQSLTSVGSSIRSTVSSKHEQQNLRRAIMNVHGQGAYDLSYKVGAIVYECRPKNKNGLCYGILDDSTEGWYPAESVEPFYMDQQL